MILLQDVFKNEAKIVCLGPQRALIWSKIHSSSSRYRFSKEILPGPERSCDKNDAVVQNIAGNDGTALKVYEARKSVAEIIMNVNRYVSAYNVNLNITS